MASRVDFSEKTARQIAGDFGLRATKIGKTGTLRQMMVGDLLVQHDAHYGGAATWRVGNVRVGYIGDAIAVAVYAQSCWHDTPFAPGGGLTRAFYEVRKQMAMKVAA
jgi:hypothetical protein